MGTMAMERPPMPPDVAAQMGQGGGGGAPPFAGVGAQMAEKQQTGDPLKSALDMTTKLWANAVKGNPKLGPYVQRALAILNAGLEEAAGSKPGGAPSENGGQTPAGPQPGQMPG